jgi:hypothetical protein
MFLQLAWLLSSRQRHRQPQQRWQKVKLQQPGQQHHVSAGGLGAWGGDPRHVFGTFCRMKACSQ